MRKSMKTFSWRTLSFWRNAVAADRVRDRNVDRVAVLVGAFLEIALEADAFDDVELARALPEIDARRLPRRGQDLGRGDLEVDVQDVLGREVDALLDAHVAVVRHARGLADRDIRLRHHAHRVDDEGFCLPMAGRAAMEGRVRI